MTLPNSAKAHEMYEDIHHPIIEVDVTCENKNCRSNEKMAVAWCFSCAFSYNNNRPMRLCNQCNKIRHSIYIRTKKALSTCCLLFTTKAELPKEGILFGTQFPSLGILIIKKVGF